MEELLPKICANVDCGNIFKPRVHNAIYCGAECRKIVTNQNVLDRYYEKKEKRSSKKRVCKGKAGKCGTILSMYNEDDEELCGTCGTTRLKDRLEGWGWDREALDEDYSY